MSKRSRDAHKMETRRSTLIASRRAQFPPHIAGSGGPTKGDPFEPGANRRHQPRSAISFGASPSANPVSARKRYARPFTAPRSGRQPRPFTPAPPAAQPGALVASLASLAVLGAGVAVANASGGGISASGGVGGTAAGSTTTDVTPGCPNKQLGRRTLKARRLRRRRRDAELDPPRQGLRRRTAGRRVRAIRPGRRSRPSRPTPTCSADGVVDAATPQALVNAMPPQRATLVRPGLLRQQTACGQTADPQHARRRPQDAALRVEGGPALQGPLRPHHGDRPRAVRQRRQVGPDPGDRAGAPLRDTDDVRVAKLGRVAK